MSLETDYDNSSQGGQPEVKDDVHISITSCRSLQPREADFVISRDRIQEHHPFSGENILNQEDDSARTPTSTDHNVDPMRISSGGFGVGPFVTQPSEVNESSYFAAGALWHLDSGSAAQLHHSSDVLSPLQNTHPSSSYQPSSTDNTVFHSDNVANDLLFSTRDPESVISASTQISTPFSNGVQATTPREVRPPPRREVPRYPDQSFAALQSQYHPLPYQPYPLRTRSSHTSDNLGYSSDSSRRSRDRSSMNSGAKTVGNTPAQSPGLFSTTYSRTKLEGDESEETSYNVPLLHPAHLQAPKEYVAILNFNNLQPFQRVMRTLPIEANMW